MSLANALLGVRVLDLSRILAGPWATQLLADLGATVWKIERPESGDDTRQWGPPWLGAPAAKMSAYFVCCNRGKQSVTIDFAEPSGANLIREWVRHADVLVENFKVGGLAAYGLDYASLSALNPKLIYCSITGYGQDGPDAGLAGYDAAIQARGGLMSINGERDDLPGGGPQKLGVAVTDLMTGLYAANAIQAALIQRAQTGQGVHIDLALLDVQVAMLANQASNYLIGGWVPKRQGSAHPNIVPYQVVRAADAPFMLAVGNDGQFQAFARLAGHAEWFEDPRFASNAARVQHRDVLINQIESALCTKPARHWLAACADAGVPATPIQNIAEVMVDPQVLHRGLVQETRRANGTSFKSVQNPITRASTAQAAPELGADTEAALAWLQQQAQI
ncbi:CoA transferase [Ahniella affigens]|uniref:CoA transferase n=1 Tax=Ahniella affigens TaxID=2021234 RepID=A0A2P1PND6_9GAMM|nr:CoA transferase [Ahniella affigens]AVP96351.1 CoA transferase [Ahniella affigens]